MKRKRIFEKSLAAALAIVITAMGSGCGSTSSTETAGTAESMTASAETAGTETASATESTSAEGTEAEEDLYGEEVTINVMAWDRGSAAPGTTTEDNAMTRWIQEQVKEKLNINVELTAVPRAESDDKLNIMMAGGSAPDIVFTYEQSLFYNYASSGALHDLTDVYAKYGSNIEEYCGEAQDISMLGDAKYAVMKQRGTENPRHVAYIRKDWLDELGMELPTTKEELGEYLYAVQENQLAGDSTIPWAMSGRADTEKVYLNFVGSYVNLESERDAYIYSEAYMAVAPGSKDGLQQLNEWYNDGLITQDFPTDTSEDMYKAAIANGNAGFVLDDTTAPWASIEVLNDAAGHETFVPVMCFDLEDGSYRNPFNPRYAMFVMIPSSVSEEKLEACMKYLNWMADPEVAVNITYTPEYETNEEGVALAPTAQEKSDLGYPDNNGDFNIMNENFSWMNDNEIMAQTNYDTQTSEWASLEWYENYYETRLVGKYTFPVYAYISDAEQTYGADIKSGMIEFVYNVICCPSDQFETVYESGYNELVNSGLQSILDARAEYYDSVNG